jgi:flavin reductase (DIM6/NTAB) family NADH-FMN oxidoreductase RutF
MANIISEDVGAFYQHYPKVAVVVTASAGGKQDAMTAAWHMAVSRQPALYCVAISAGHFTYELISKSREFGINFLPDIKAELAAAIGGSRGREIDKFKEFGIATDKPAKTSAPVLADAYATFECKLIDDRLYADHRLLVGEIAAVHYNKDVFMEDGRLNLQKAGPVLYTGADTYLELAGCKERKIDRKLAVEKIKSQRG